VWTTLSWLVAAGVVEILLAVAGPVGSALERGYPLRLGLIIRLRLEPAEPVGLG